jgi:hypothetical protein
LGFRSNLNINFEIAFNSRSLALPEGYNDNWDFLDLEIFYYRSTVKSILMNPGLVIIVSDLYIRKY